MTSTSNAVIWKNQCHFAAFLLHFWNLHQIFNISKKIELYSLSSSEIIDSKRYGC